MGETSSENPTRLVAGSGEAFFILFEFNFEGSELPPRSTWQCLVTFWVVMIVMTWGWGGIGTTGIYWVETRDSAKYPAMHRTAPTAEYPAQNVNSVQALETM